MARMVLVVDDSPSFRATASALLRARGYDVVGVAADGKGALSAARRLRPDAVLLDFALPDMDGGVVAARLAEVDRAPVVVLVSTFDAPAVGDAVTAAGVRGFLPKAELASPRLVELLGPP